MLDDLKNKVTEVTGNMKDLGQSLGFNFFSKEKADMLLEVQKKYESRNLKGNFSLLGGLIIFWGLGVLGIAFKLDYYSYKYSIYCSWIGIDNY